MSFIGDAIGSVIGGVTGAKQSAKGAQQAANIQAGAADRAIAEQRAARFSNEERQQPFVDAGRSAISQQMALLGLNGTAAQQSGIRALLSSPQYTTGVQQGEEAILQNASATGGLRGGNVQNSLANFRSGLLSNLLTQQMSMLGGVSSLGQNAAAGVGNAGVASAGQIGDLLQQQGAALAGGQIAKGNATTMGFNNLINVGATAANLADALRRPKSLTQPPVTAF